MAKKGHPTEGGRYYGIDGAGRMHDAAPGEPDAVICRRVSDYPLGLPPVGATVGQCADCQAVIAWDPSGPWKDKPHVCLQCRGIEPLPFPKES